MLDFGWQAEFGLKENLPSSIDHYLQADFTAYMENQLEQAKISQLSPISEGQIREIFGTDHTFQGGHPPYPETLLDSIFLRMKKNGDFAHVIHARGINGGNIKVAGLVLKSNCSQSVSFFGKLIERRGGIA